MLWSPRRYLQSSSLAGISIMRQSQQVYSHSEQHSGTGLYSSSSPVQPNSGKEVQGAPCTADTQSKLRQVLLAVWSKFWMVPVNEIEDIAGSNPFAWFTRQRALQCGLGWNSLCRWLISRRPPDRGDWQMTYGGKTNPKNRSRETTTSNFWHSFCLRGWRCLQEARCLSDQGSCILQWLYIYAKNMEW